MPDPLPAAPVQTPKPQQYSFKKRVKITLAGWLGSTYMHTLGGLMRLHAAPYSRLEPYRVDGGSALIAMWHGPHFPVLYAYRNRGVVVVTSLSADGEILTRVLHSMGYTTVRGSSSRGGTSAMLNMARSVKAGHDAAIAVDGPKGPRYRVKEGILVLAKLTGCPVVPVAATIDRCWRVPSWDIYRIPKPFSHAIVTGGRPIMVPPDASDELIEDKRKELELRLRWMTREMDQLSTQPQGWKQLDAITERFIHEEPVEVEI